MKKRDVNKTMLKVLNQELASTRIYVNTFLKKIMLG